jgi:parallel beta-helix repeat protein
VNKRLLSRTLLIVIMICGFALAGATRFGTVKAATNVTGILSSDTTWTKAGSPYTFTGNVLVENHVTLTIESGVTVNFGDYYMKVNGTLTSRGASGDPIRFNGGYIEYTQYHAGWDEQTDSGCIIEHAVLTSTNITVLAGDPVKISKNTIEAEIEALGLAIISDNTINGYVAGRVITGNTVTGDVRGNTISNNVITGKVYGGDVVSDNTVNGEVTASYGTVTNNYITSTDSLSEIGVSCSGSASVSNNVISGYSTGVAVGSHWYGASGFSVIENNVITDNEVGISIGIFIRDWVGTSIPTIQNNMISRNTKGITFAITLQEMYGDRPPTTIQSNTISQNEVGIELYSVSYCTLHDNNIQENSGYNIYLGEAQDFNATYNWWGTTDTATIDDSIYDFHDDFDLGKVNYTPFLTEPNPEAHPKDAPTTPSPTPTPTPTATPEQTPPATSEPTPTPTPTQEPTQNIPFEVIVGAAVIVAVIGAGLGLLFYLIKRK